MSSLTRPVRRILDRLRTSYWFLPSVMCIGSVLFAVVLTTWDLSGGLNLDAIPWLVANQANGARALLSMVAGSMITVAGVAFSVTLVALATAAGTFGPRLLDLFLGDRAVQGSLGAFCATFLYCMLVLRLVGPDGTDAAFVPQVAVLGAILLAVVSLFVFIYFVHHIAQSMNISTVIARAADELRGALRAHESVDATLLDENPFDGSEGSNVYLIRSTTSGYLRAPNHTALARLLESHQAFLEIVAEPGEYVSKGKLVAKVYASEPLGAEVTRGINEAFETARSRSSIDDPDFFLDQLAQIAGRALSPGVNDPFTAMTVIDAVEGALAEYEPGEGEWRGWSGPSGELRVIAHHIGLCDRLESAYGQIAPYACDDPLASRHLDASLRALIEGSGRPERRLTIEGFKSRLGSNGLAVDGR